MSAQVSTARYWLLISSLVFCGATLPTFAQQSPTDREALDALSRRVQQLEAVQLRLIEAIGSTRVLAIADVKDKKLRDRTSSRGVRFEGGKVSFPNERHLRFVPLIADSQESSYITEHQWITEFGVDREDADRGYFIVKSHAMDTGGANRTSDAHNFTAIVIGLDDALRP
jgi:hypothetical protein